MKSKGQILRVGRDCELVLISGHNSACVALAGQFIFTFPPYSSSILIFIRLLPLSGEHVT